MRERGGIEFYDIIPLEQAVKLVMALFVRYCTGNWSIAVLHASILAFHFIQPYRDSFHAFFIVVLDSIAIGILPYIIADGVGVYKAGVDVRAFLSMKLAGIRISAYPQFNRIGGAVRVHIRILLIPLIAVCIFGRRRIFGAVRQHEFYIVGIKFISYIIVWIGLIRLAAFQIIARQIGKLIVAFSCPFLRPGLSGL